jgi:Tol biopolymer transport system component
MLTGIATFAIIIIAGTLYYFMFANNSSELLPPMKTVRLTSFPGEERDPALSPDGKSIAFSWNGERQDNFDIYVKLVDAGVPVRLTTDASVDNRPVWSPDGSFIAFVREIENPSDNLPKAVFIIPALGGREQKIINYHPGLNEHPSISWSSDNKFIFYTNWSSKDTGFVIYKVSIQTKEIEQITQLPHGTWGDQSPSVSPDGKYVAFIRRKSPLKGDIYVKNLLDSNVQPITNVEAWIDGFSWNNDSRSIIFSGNIDGSSALWKSDLSGSKMEKIVSGINVNNPSTSVTGNRLAYAETIENTNIWKIDLQNPGKETLLISSSTFANSNPDISPDGKKIIFSSNRTGNLNIWMCENDGTNQTQLTFFNKNLFGRGKWSPNGLEILIVLENEHYLLNASGGTPRKIETFRMFPTWTEDGTGFYCAKYPENKLYLFSKNGKPQKQITKGFGIIPYVYLDYIFYIKDWDHHDIWRIPVNGGEEEPVLLGMTDLLIFQWVVTKNGIYYARNNNGSPVLDFYKFQTRQRSQIKELPETATGFFSSFEIAPDESYILYSKREPTKSDIILVENFRAE